MSCHGVGVLQDFPVEFFYFFGVIVGHKDKDALGPGVEDAVFNTFDFGDDSAFRESMLDFKQRVDAQPVTMFSRRTCTKSSRFRFAKKKYVSSSVRLGVKGIILCSSCPRRILCSIGDYLFPSCLFKHAKGFISKL